MSALANCPTQIVHNRAKGATDKTFFEFEDCGTNPPLFPIIKQRLQSYSPHLILSALTLEALEHVPTRYLFLKPTPERDFKCFLAIRDIKCAVSRYFLVTI